MDFINWVAIRIKKNSCRNWHFVNVEIVYLFLLEKAHGSLQSWCVFANSIVIILFAAAQFQRKKLFLSNAIDFDFRGFQKKSNQKHNRGIPLKMGEQYVKKVSNMKSMTHHTHPHVYMQILLEKKKALNWFDFIRFDCKCQISFKKYIWMMRWHKPKPITDFHST